MTAALTCPSCGHEVTPPQGEFLTVGSLTLRSDLCMAYAHDTEIVLPPYLCRPLAALMRYPEQLLGLSYLLDASDIWGSPHTLAVYFSHLRKIVGHVVEIRPHQCLGYSIHARGL